MTTSVHSTLTGSDLHESKGVSTALSGTVYVANGAGSGAWTPASSVITNTAFTTGDLKMTHKSSADATWILWSDGTIGDGSSSATIRANADTAALFALYWTYGNTLCPIAGGYGVSAAADFAAHKAISVPLGAGRVFGLAGSGSGLTARTLGQSTGGETTVLTASQIPSITSTNSGISVATAQSGLFVNNAGGAGGGNVGIEGSAGGNNAAYSGTACIFMTSTVTQGISTSNNTSGTAHTNMQPTAFVNVMIKL